MFKPQLLWLGFLSLGTLVSLAPSAAAQCVVADVSIQAAIHGSDQPAEQINDVAVDAPETCRGNTSVHTSRQVHVGGTGEVRQTRQSRHQIRSAESGASRSTSGSTVVVPVEVQVDVYNPAERLRSR
ncbi:hypothetical protein [Nodosilinea sp. P-1105]|uniref:hypothetical protein n=1 Tax=Nodosilinea sp. P-1105 TaxID=2546229 RepID=UPI00146AB048|nr:hypothetical protein [Nodosilinea sp. P-1105]NMF86177.1 hypothetical protein [Nodosilinea sp. P-1105]